MRAADKTDGPTAHSYQYSFCPNPRWSALYAPGPEIRRYLQGVAQKFGAMRFIKTQHKVERCDWDAAEKKWYVILLLDFSPFV